MNEVEALPQMKLPSANEEGLCPMKLRFAQTVKTRVGGGADSNLSFSAKKSKSKGFLSLLHGK